MQTKLMGLILAASAIKELGLINVSFFTDCGTLANAADSRNLIDNPGHWRVRPITADFHKYASCLHSLKVNHIPRAQNILSHSLVKKAFMCRSI